MRLRDGHQPHLVARAVAEPAGLTYPLFNTSQLVLERHHSAHLNERIPPREKQDQKKTGGICAPPRCPSVTLLTACDQVRALARDPGLQIRLLQRTQLDAVVDLIPGTGQCPLRSWNLMGRKEVHD